jgi:hypothetical protein
MKFRHGWGDELMEIQGVIPPPIPRSWWQRNWKWVIPVGVVGGLAVLACFVGVIFLFVFGIFKGSDAYIDAIAQARRSPAVLRELGEPIQPGWWVSGSIKCHWSHRFCRLCDIFTGSNGTRDALCVSREASPAQEVQGS